MARTTEALRGLSDNSGLKDEEGKQKGRMEGQHTQRPHM